MFRLNVFSLLSLLQLVKAQNQLETPCLSATDTYTMKLDMTSEIAYYTIEECGDRVNPTIAMIVGKTYNFVQEDRSNYYHPVGFAYLPDGAHDGVDELEPGIKPAGSSSTCDETMSCPAPMYFLNEKYLGKYSNLMMDGVPAPTEGLDDFGLDAYEPLFFHPIADWTDKGIFSVKLKFDVYDFEKDIFYFCHIHQFMSGRIKLLDEDRNQLQPFASDPPINYTYDMPGPFDKMCGTYGLDDFQLPNTQCYPTYTCNVPTDPDIKNFADCIDAMDCAMTVGMTTGASAGSKVALFINQMIPHHQNAINMAKALLKTGKVQCADLTEETDGCALEAILWEIIGNQSFQIQQMKGVADGGGYSVTDDCEIEFDGKQGPTNPPIENSGDGGGDDAGDEGGDGTGDDAGDEGGDGTGDDAGDNGGSSSSSSSSSDEEPMPKKGKKGKKGKMSFIGDGAGNFLD